MSSTTVAPHTIEAMLSALNAAHEASALRGNPSHEALKLATVGSGSYVQAIAAALMTLGGLHAPLAATCALLRTGNPLERAKTLLAEKKRVPGWGNGFVKDRADPIWEPVDRVLREYAPESMREVDAITQHLHETGKRLYPNPSCYTAVVAIALRIPDEASPYLFVSARLNAWSEEFCRVYRGRP